MHSSSLSYVERLLSDFQADPASVPEEWRAYFSSIGLNGHRAATGPSFPASRLFGSPTARPVPAVAPSSQVGVGPGAGRPAAPAVSAPGAPGSDAVLQHAVDEMVRAYRTRGHLAADINPLQAPVPHAELEPAAFGIGAEDLDREVWAANFPGPDVRTVGAIHQRVKSTYCGSIGIELMHIDNLQVRTWLYERLEVPPESLRLDADTQRRILKRLTAAAVFEEFIQKKYLGAKSFSLEGAESLIPLLDLAIEKAGADGVKEIVLGMAHRGRLNVLFNILGKHPSTIFREFEDSEPELFYGRGDVKYHLGHSHDWTTTTGRQVHLSLAFNPSHLEFINPVAMGRIRAKQDRIGDVDRTQGMVLLIHGDAAFAGEGVVGEALNLSQLPSHTVGGTLHVVVNNQIGFTTSPEDARSNTYATDVAKMLQIPIFHVNGEDPEAVAHVVEVALDFRREFRRDVVLDMYCYRRRGHNEGDEPAFTQPLLYAQIRQRHPVRVHYVEHLLASGGIERKEAEALIEEQEKALEEALQSARQPAQPTKPQAYGAQWRSYVGGVEANCPEVDTPVNKEEFGNLLTALSRVPPGFTPHPKLVRLLQARADMATAKKPLDWSTAEALAFASVASAGIPIRMTGQDVERGTFSQRHAVLHDVENGQQHSIFSEISKAKGAAPVHIYNSALSETAVLGFEYGYSLDLPEGLILWEAQFGDFSNAAQVVIDQFLASGEDKWHRLSGLVLLLPHGFEGQGPEHSSARLERWLTLSAEDNIQVAIPTTPAQYFHVLRRQALRKLRKPLILFTPKSLLRHPAVISPREEFVAGAFARVISDPLLAKKTTAKKVRRVVLCSGKIYYELLQQRAALEPVNARSTVALVRIEQLYPMPATALQEAMVHTADSTDVVWVQEEPRNMGAWPFLRLNYGDRLLERFNLRGLYRNESASPATGSAKSHRIEQDELLNSAFANL